MLRLRGASRRPGEGEARYRTHSIATRSSQSGPPQLVPPTGAVAHASRGGCRVADSGLGAGEVGQSNAWRSSRPVVPLCGKVVDDAALIGAACYVWTFTPMGASDNASEAVMILQSVIICPSCGTAKPETMQTDSCRILYECTGCGATLRPKAGDCCVFCSYGSVPCPPVQAERSGEAPACCAG